MSDAPAAAAGPDPQRAWLTKRTIAGGAIFLGVLVFFLTQTRLPAVLSKLPTLGSPASARDQSTFSELVDPQAFPSGLRWVAFGLNLWDANAIGMFFAILLGGAAAAAVNPETRLSSLLRRRGRTGAGLGGGLGMPLFMCSACSAPVSLGFYRAGASLEVTLGVILGSALFNPVALFAIFLLMPVQMALARVGFGALALFVLVPLLARGEARDGAASSLEPARGIPQPPPATAANTWAAAARDALVSWWWHTRDVALRLVPAMFAAGFVVGIVLMGASPQRLSDAVGSPVLAIVVAAAVGTLLQLPTLFEIPLVLGVLALGLGVGPAAALLVTAPSSGVVTFGILRRDLGARTPALLLGGTFVGGTCAGLLVHAL